MTMDAAVSRGSGAWFWGFEGLGFGSLGVRGLGFRLWGLGLWGFRV